MVQLDYLSHYGPSICVKFFERFVLAGYGPFIHVYDYKTGELLNIARIFNRNKVHGISVKGDHILAYGARSLSVITIQNVLEQRTLINFEKNCHEWIIDAEFSASGESIFLLTSYNKVICCSLDGTVDGIKAVFGERSILYSGSIKVFDDERVYVNAGTVMGGVIIWDLFSEEKIYNFTGHEGSIFYVTLSDDGKYIATCSDDRSIKLWNMDTGELMSTAWGHTARIWNLQFFDNDKKLVSVSEDCTCRVWDIMDNGVVKQRDAYEVHLTKNVWGVDVQSSEMIAVTSGNDGTLKLTDLKPLDRNGDEVHVFLRNDFELDGLKLEVGEIFKGFFWLKFGLIAVTSHGQVLRYNQITSRWNAVLQDEKLSSYTMTSGVQDIDTVVFCNNNCDLILMKFQRGNGHLLSKVSLHVEEISKCTNCLVAFEENRLLVTLESPKPSDNFLCLQFDVDSLEMCNKYQWKKPSGFFSSSLCVWNDYLIVGSKLGSMFVFTFSNPQYDALMLRRLCPGDTITSVKFVETLPNGESLFSITNRDGYYLFLSINVPERRYKIVHSNKISKGFLEGAFYNEDGDYIVYGFKSDHFYMFNETKQFEIMSELCGGAHRQWKLFKNFIPGEYVLVYVKAGNIHLRRVHQRNIPQTLVDGTHGREIRDLSIRGSHPYRNGYLFCSASEDTTIKLAVFERESGIIKNFWTQRKHTSGLQRCKFISDKYMISSAAREELYLWELNTQFSTGPYMNLLKELPPSSKNPDLRIMDFDYKMLDNGNFLLATVYSDSAIKVWIYNSKTNEFNLLIQGRYETCCLLNVALIHLHERDILLVGPTDGHLVYWDISKYSLFHFSEVANDQGGAEESHLLPKYDGRILVHKAGIKDLAVRVTSGACFKAYTVGDDNAVAISTFSLNTAGFVSGAVSCLEDRGGASTITSLDLIEQSDKLITTSVDQNVRVYDISSDGLILELKTYTTIADTGCSAVLNESDKAFLLIGGVGLSVAKLTKLR